jgi:transcriptional regulator with XRE-family HTH domain
MLWRPPRIMLKAAALREARELLGLTPTQAARKARISLAYWLNIEAGRRPNPSGDVLVRVAHAVNASVESIMPPGNIPDQSTSEVPAL